MRQARIAYRHHRHAGGECLREGISLPLPKTTEYCETTFDRKMLSPMLCDSRRSRLTSLPASDRRAPSLSSVRVLVNCNHVRHGQHAEISDREGKAEEASISFAASSHLPLA